MGAPYGTPQGVLFPCKQSANPYGVAHPLAGVAMPVLTRRIAMCVQHPQVASATYYFIQVPSFEKVLNGTFSPEDVYLSVVSERPEHPENSKEAQAVYLIKNEIATLDFLAQANRFGSLKKACSLVEQHTPFESIKKLIETNRNNKTDWIEKALKKQFDEKDAHTVSRSL